MSRAFRLLGSLVIQAPLVASITCATTAIAFTMTTKDDPLLVPASEAVRPHWWNWLFPWILEVAFGSGGVGSVAGCVMTMMAFHHREVWLTRRPMLLVWSLIALTMVVLGLTAILVTASVLRGVGV